MSLTKSFLIFVFCVLSSKATAKVETFPNCNEMASNEPCFAQWVTENGSFYMGLIKNGLLNGKGAAVFPDGSKYVGDFQAGRRHGYGVLIMDDVTNYRGQISIGTWQNGGRVGNTLYSWPSGDYFYGFTQGGVIRSELTIADFSEWKRAFYDLAIPQRKAIQTFLGRANLTTERSIYNYPVDGVWGRNTFNALATYAALMKPEQFNLLDYRSAQSVLQEILTTGGNNSPFGYIIGEPSTTHSASTPACPDDLQATKYKCFGSLRNDDGSVYVGDFLNGLPNGAGELSRDGFVFSGMFENGVLVGTGSVTENGNTIWEGNWSEFSTFIESDANTDEKPEELIPSTGSGFFVTTDGHIVSNNHVIENCSFVTGSVDGKSNQLDILATDP